jgi:hypothetical protein
MEHPRAFLALIGFVFMAIWLVRKQPLPVAASLIVVIGSLFLPESGAFLDVRFVPVIEKERVTYLTLLLAALVWRADDIKQARPGKGPECMVFLFVLSWAFTLSMNRQPLFNIGEWRQGLNVYWLVSQTLDDLLTWFLPVFLGRAVTRSTGDLVVLMRVIVGAGIVYTGLLFLEVLMSIPFRSWSLSWELYGVAMRPMWRYGFFQPMVFMDNGLSAASYMAIAVICAFALHRARVTSTWFGMRRIRLLLLSGQLVTFNVAGNVYGFAIAAITRVFRPKVIAFVSLGLAALACMYPALQMADLFPDKQLVEFANKYDPDRGRSLKGRFDEEDFVLGNLGDRLWVGWGMFIRIPGALEFGEGEGGLDSYFVIRTGMAGIIGLELVFLMLAIPIWFACRHLGAFASDRERLLVAALSCCVAVRLIDLLVNGVWNYFPAFLAGALYGVVSSAIRAQALIGSRSRS